MTLKKPTKLENILAFSPLPFIGEFSSIKRAHYKVERDDFIRNNYHNATRRMYVAKRNSVLLTRGAAYSPLLLGLLYYTF